MSKDYEKHIDLIQAVMPKRLQEAQNHLDSLTKPPGSLGVLEDLACRFSAFREKPFPAQYKKSLFCVCRRSRCRGGEGQCLS